ncbi:TonB-dependent receptor [Mucilaginibacter sp. JRF]|uniref:TonB-dependent receptor n=1 Tax=Mucilaginibacter sp. JRF TaxID=2780088 RepID=UPI00187E7094|nr:TonB-dependent receptor [Mucilaginibacter sp. JRF]MBE9584275.1 TonB-dependent receptor [Mucilaginibacter sp. JRF]
MAQNTTAVVTGKVTDDSGKPVEAANVYLKGTRYQTMSLSDGSFELKAKEGSYTLIISYTGSKSHSQSVKLQAGQSLTIATVTLSNATEMQEVNVQGKTTSQNIREQGFQVNVIDLKAQYNTTSDLNQVLNRTTGVRIREEGGLGSYFNFSLNGFTGNQVKFFLDGIPMDNFGSSLTLNNLPVNIAERIEVYKGVVPVSLGTDALGGAVNVVTRSNANYLDASYSIGSFNTHRAAVSGAYTNPNTHFTVKANAFYNYSDNDYKVNVAPIDLFSRQTLPARDVRRFHDNYESAGGQIEAGFTGTKFADKLLIGMLASGNDRDIQTGVVMEQVYGARTARSHSFIPTLKYKKTNLFIPGLDVSMYGAYNMSTNRFIDTSSLVYNWLGQSKIDSAGRGEQSLSQRKNKDNEGLVTTNLSYRLNEHHSFSYNYILTDFKRKASDVEDPTNPTFLLPQRLRKQNMGLSWKTDYGNFTATAFGKLYLFHAESFENVSQNNTPDYQTTSLNSTHYGYGLATAYFILPQLQAKASYEKAYRLPEATEILGDGLYVAANPNLKPESSHNFNLGAVYTLQPSNNHRFDFEGNFIMRNARDYIRPFQGQVQPVARQNTNVGKVATKGAELEIRYAWKKLIFASVNATYQDIVDSTEFLSSTNLTGTIVTRNLNYGYRLQNIPYLFCNLNLGTRIPDVGARNNQLGINYSLNMVEKYYLTPSQLGNNNQDVIPRQIAHNISADYAMQNGKYTITLECRNLTDNMLFDNFRLQKPGRSVFLKLRYFITK